MENLKYQVLVWKQSRKDESSVCLKATEYLIMTVKNLHYRRFPLMTSPQYLIQQRDSNFFIQQYQYTSDKNTNQKTIITDRVMFPVYFGILLFIIHIKYAFHQNKIYCVKIYIFYCNNIIMYKHTHFLGMVTDFGQQLKRKLKR